MYKPLRDKKLKFNSKKHEYKVGGQKLRSVTSWIKSFFTPFDDKTISKYVAKKRRAQGEKITATQVRKEWKQIAQTGTDIHKEIEDYILNKKDILDIQDLKSMAGINFFEHIKSRYKNATYHPEVQVYDLKHSLAGTIDLLVLTPEGAYLFDWKTNKKLYTQGKNKTNHPITGELPDVNMTHYQLQLSTYAYILRKEYGLDVKGLSIVHLTEIDAEEIVVEYNDIVEEMLLHEKEQKN